MTNSDPMASTVTLAPETQAVVVFLGDGGDPIILRDRGQTDPRQISGIQARVAAARLRAWAELFEATGKILDGPVTDA